MLLGDGFRIGMLAAWSTMAGHPAPGHYEVRRTRGHGGSPPTGSWKDRGRSNDRAQTHRQVRHNTTVAFQPWSASMLPALRSRVGRSKLASRGPALFPQTASKGQL